MFCTADLTDQVDAAIARLTRRAKKGDPGATRTHGLYLRRVALYPLSYGVGLPFESYQGPLIGANRSSTDPCYSGFLLGTQLEDANDVVRGRVG
jgi:hypothetical protein